jgi:hypothetical protein
LILGKFPEGIMDFIYITWEGKEFGSYIIVQTPNFSLPVKIYCYCWIYFTNFTQLRDGTGDRKKFP